MIAVSERNDKKKKRIKEIINLLSVHAREIIRLKSSQSKPSFFVGKKENSLKVFQRRKLECC